jgi:exodeoxyribonuclease VII large subunit
MENTPISVSEAIALVNQTMEYAFPVLVVEGEVSSFKVNQSRYVFFDIKDATGTLGCFMTVYQLRTQLEDGMRVRVIASPKLTQWGKFSLTVRDVQPVGEGSLKRAFDLLKEKLEKEGLFAPERKRRLPELPEHIAVISSTAAAGYVDFITILGKRWGGMEIEVAHTQVQGVEAPKQIVRALSHFNSQENLPEVIVIVRGGGSADDLAAFNDEPLVRAIASSRVPVLVGVGHEVDVTLADLAADVRAATPSNAAEILVPDRRELIAELRSQVRRMLQQLQGMVQWQREEVMVKQTRMLDALEDTLEHSKRRFSELGAVLKQLDPKLALKRGYAFARLESGELLRDGSKVKKGDHFTLELAKHIIKAGVEDVTEKTA